ncbi:putative hydrolase of the HAD superfamily [Evansella caseinilytica]|uniref:Putative hydrolase of the HAD superfamily n=1 Tax=Evansella caseinilytica TaxID=1503961 RepID=A0A1H3KRE4_9BACI|nr:HAD-IA family hydrolase [Evansella caseinilytica]SDY54244.1 putative hydrolase of the HAD superfamily [Evansella caseinilytica]
MYWKGIGFDLDNTLFSHEAAFRRAIHHCFNTFIAKHQPVKEISFERFYALFKYNSDAFWEKFENQEWTKTEYRRSRFNETMKAVKLPYGDDEADRFHHQYFHIVDDCSEPYPFLHSLLAFLQEQQVTMFVITNGMTDTQYGKLEKIGAAQWIPKEMLIVSEEVGCVKPDRQIFRLAEERVNLTAKQLLFIGDSWKHDVVGALEAGWDAIFLNTRQEKRSTSHRPIKEFATLEKAAAFLMNAIGRRENI